MKSKKSSPIYPAEYKTLFKDITKIYEDAQESGNENWNQTSLYSNWKIGERIVEVEQEHRDRANSGDRLLKQLSDDLNRRFGKGFSDRNLRYMRKFYQCYKVTKINSILSWSHYKTLLLVEDRETRTNLEEKAIAENLSQRDLLIKVNAALSGSNDRNGSRKPAESGDSLVKTTGFGAFPVSCDPKNFS